MLTVKGYANMKKHYHTHAHGEEKAAPENAAASPETKEAPPASASAPAAPAPDAAQAEIAALKDRLLRLQADFDNFRKRTLREREDVGRRAVEGLVREWLSVLDHFEMGLETADKIGLDPAVRAGFQLVYDQMRGLCMRVGLEPVDALGKPFDHNLHESVALAPSDEHARDVVVHVVRKGYRLGGQLLRPAQVVISSGPAVSASVPAEDEADATTQG